MIESLVLLDVGGRLAGYLVRLARESGTLGEDGWYSVSRPTHQVIANTIGASRETVTRLLRQFEERELIRARGSSVWIRDEPRRTTPSGTRKPISGTDDAPSGTDPDSGKTAAPTAPRKGGSGRRK
jgi:DNA-binding transcriptional MocR family regulator